MWKWLDDLGRWTTASFGAVGSLIAMPFAAATGHGEWAKHQYDLFSQEANETGGRATGAVSRNVVQPTTKAVESVPVVGPAVESVADQVAKVFKADAWLYRNGIQRPMSTFATAWSLTDSDRWKKQQNEGFLGSLFDSATWGKAWGISSHRTFGQALSLAFATRDILDADEVEDARRQWWWDVTTGGVDAPAAFFLDPLGKAGKIIGASGALRTTKDFDVLSAAGKERQVQRAVQAGKPVSKVGKEASQNLTEQFRTNTPLNDTMNWADQISAKYADPRDAAKHISKLPIFRNNANGGLLASLLANSNPGEKRQIMRLAYGDASAYKELNAQRPDLAAQIRSLTDTRDDLMRAQAPKPTADGGATPPTPAVDQERLGTLNREINALERRERYLDTLTGRPDEPSPGIIGVLSKAPKGGVYQKIAKGTATARYRADMASQRGTMQGWHWYNMFNTPVQVVGKLNYLNQKRPRGFYDMNAQDGWREVDDMLRQVKGFSPQRRSQIVSRLMGAPNEASKIQYVRQAEAEAISHTLARRDLSPGMIKEITDSTLSQRDALRARMTERAYSATFGDAGQRIDYFNEHGYPSVVLPVTKTQLAEKIPLVDIQALDRAAGRYRNSLRLLTGKNLRDPAIQLGDMLSSAWKSSVLLRLGYPVRLSGDDQMAMQAKLGAMVWLGLGMKGAANFADNQYTRMRNAYRLAALEAGKRRQIGLLGGAKLRTGDLKAIEPRERFKAKRLGQEDVNVPLLGGGSVDVNGMFPRNRAGDYWRDLSATDRHVLMETEDQYLRQMRSEYSTGLLSNGETGYWSAWRDALNKQLGQDPLAKIFLNGGTEDDALRWLKTDAGRRHGLDLPFRRHDPQAWASNVKTMVDQYAPILPLREAALKGEVTNRMLKTAVPHLKAASRELPQVHGPTIAHNLGRGAVAESMTKLRDGWFRLASDMPTDILTKHPMAKAIYDGRIKQLVKAWHATGGEIDNDTLAKLESQARRFAIGEVNKVVLDLSVHSNAAHLFRFVSPFYSAWEETLKRWGRLIDANPGLLFRANDIWQGLNKIAGTDLVDADGNKIEGFTGLKNADEQYITFRIPRWLGSKIDGLKYFDRTQIPKSSLNITLQGDPWWLPGFGPMAQIPASLYADSRPNDAQALKFILPFGPQSIKDLVLPPAAKQATKGEDDTDFTQTTIRIWQIKFQQWQNAGMKGPPPSPNDPQIQKDAKAFHSMQTYTKLLLPFSAKFTSPYQFYIDQYHKFLQENPAKARDMFLAKYPDYFVFTQSVSKNNAQIPATLKAFNASKKFKDLIAKHPDLAPVILGPSMDGDAFDPAVYNKQFEQKLAPGSTKTYRQHQSLEDFAHEAVAQDGWNAYMQFMDIFRAELARRGATSLNDAGTDDLAAIKRAVIAQLSKKFPAWAQDYNSFNPKKTDQYVTDFRQIVNEPELANNPGRTDIQTLRQYLGIRDLVLQALATRAATGGARSLQAKSNADLAGFWQNARDSLAESDTMFSRNIFDRYLNGDTQLVAP